MVKLADRLQNLRTLGSCTPEKQKRKRSETLDVYMPFIDSLLANRSLSAKLGDLNWLRHNIERACHQEES